MLLIRIIIIPIILLFNGESSVMDELFKGNACFGNFSLILKCFKWFVSGILQISYFTVDNGVPNAIKVNIFALACKNAFDYFKSGVCME